MQISFLRTRYVWFRVAILFSCLAVIQFQAADQPNIVLIMADDMGYTDIGCYGSEIDTPCWIDSLERVFVLPSSITRRVAVPPARHY